ncbi:signal recognition particle-docking protein FtsY [Cognatilysobacter segetis]|uniref:signal recognition particle-docking protein FtsY n=1 Tax=Cognatilysobacter segetis TaxID=2492394 RepID=UPI00105CF1F1|nr:signal recognition particle-docking protein FtsY [Lysobacter segetis]
MLSFLRRKKPNEPERRLSVEELAAAFPGQESQAPADVADAEATPQATAGAAVESAEDSTARAESSVEATVNDPAASAPAAEWLAAEAPTAREAKAADAEARSMRETEAAHARPAPAAVFTAPLESMPSAPAPIEPDVTGAVPTVPAAAAGKRGWLDRLRGNTFTRSISGLFSRNPKLDDDLLDEIETALLTADVGVTATTELVDDLRKRMKSREFTDANALLAALRADLLAMLEPVARPLVIDRAAKPFVLLTIGVNGVGKTTTIGKLAKRFKDEGRPLMLAAGDTFRAAAVAQLQAWGDRNGVAVIAQGQNADAASVAFDALQAAKARGTEVLIADTAGRLHTQQGLMAELGKIKRVLQKLDPAAPHEVLLVIDGTTGQNAISQLRQFNAAIGVTGLVVTKLDGTAKGGVVFALAREFGIPIRFAGIGERPEDLRVFDAAAFVDALLPESLGAG